MFFKDEIYLAYSMNNCEASIFMIAFRQIFCEIQRIILLNSMIDFPKLENFFLNSRNFSLNSRNFSLNTRFREKKLTNVCGKMTKKPLDYTLMCYETNGVWIWVSTNGVFVFTKSTVYSFKRKEKAPSFCNIKTKNRQKR